MPFIGVLPEREPLFKPAPRREVPVSDAAAWRLNPAHRHIYDKLRLALAAGLTAAPCGVAPMDLGLAPATEVFVKPITNLAGMGLSARALRADEVPLEPGSYWSERLTGTHTSSDCLVQDGEPRWFAHTRGSDEKDASRPLYWQIGAELPEVEAWVGDWVRRTLGGYTGLCNIELIGGRPIEAHLRGSNGFFDLYGPDFLPAWVALVDGEAFSPPPPIPGGYVISVFGEADLSAANRQAAEALGVRVQPDPSTPGRAAILRCREREAGFEAYRRLTGRALV
ncbi:MAG: hypothetical protein ACLFNA_11835 [Halochromatium sp.]